MPLQFQDWIRSISFAILVFTVSTLQAAETPSVKLALSFRPVQKGVEIETPAAAEFEQCQVKVERGEGGSGWIVFGPAGQIVRRFVDTNGDNVVDQWRYYNQGLEVYRDIDGNFNNKVDQSRWLNTGGSRWGLDTNEDGRIDRWKVLSAEEATQVAIAALIDSNPQLLATVLLDAQDVKSLELNAEVAKKLLDAVADPATKMRELLAKSKMLSKQSQWRNFDSSTPPGVIPTEDGKAAQDLNVYTNAMAIVETDGKPGFVQIGEMLRVGEVWKLTQIPLPLEDQSAQLTVTGVLMQPSLTSAAAVPSTSDNPETRKLLQQLQELDRNAPTPTSGPAALARYNSQRADVLARLITQAESDDERSQWTRQMVDGLAAAVQTGGYAAGLERLKQVEAELQREAPKSDLLAYVSYRRLLADYYQRIQTANTEERVKVQAWWLEQLEGFVKTNPAAEDTPEALWQLAISNEFGGKLPEAKQWYTTLVKEHGDSHAGQRAEGALLRLELEGKSLDLSGPTPTGQAVDLKSYRGKVVLVAFWATWCKPCTEDLPQIRALYDQHRRSGFEIIGVNLDITKEPIAGYLSQHRVAWPQIHHPGGLVESESAKQFGIISLPTMFLVDKQGNVVNSNISVADLKTQLPELLAK